VTVSGAEGGLEKGGGRTELTYSNSPRRSATGIVHSLEGESEVQIQEESGGTCSAPVFLWVGRQEGKEKKLSRFSHFNRTGENGKGGGFR